MKLENDAHRECGPDARTPASDAPAGPPRRYRSGYIRTLPAISPAASGRNTDWNEASAKGSAWYEAIRAELEAQHYGWFVYIDVTSGAYQVDTDPVTARHKLLARFPDANLWGVRILRQGSSKEAAGDD